MKDGLRDSKIVFWSLVAILSLLMVLTVSILTRGATITHDYTNGAYSSLSATVSSGSTTLSVQTGEGDRFPQTGDLIRAVIYDAACAAASLCAENQKEFLDIRWSSGDLFDIVSRATHTGEGGLTTPPANWPPDSKIDAAVTAGILREQRDILNGGITGSQPYEKLYIDELVVTRQSGTPGKLELYSGDSTTQAVTIQGPAAGGAPYTIELSGVTPSTNSVPVVSGASGTTFTLGWTTVGGGGTGSGTVVSTGTPSAGQLATFVTDSIHIQGLGIGSGLAVVDGMLTASTSTSNFQATNPVLSSGTTFTTTDFAGMKYYLSSALTHTLPTFAADGRTSILVTGASVTLRVPHLSDVLTAYSSAGTTTTLTAGHNAVLDQIGRWDIACVGANDCRLYGPALPADGGLQDFAITFTPSSPFSFPTTSVGVTSSQTVTVTNSGSLTLTTGLVSMLTNTPISLVSSGCSTVTLASGETCTIGIQFAPLIASSWTDTLSVAFGQMASQMFVSSGTGTTGGGGGGCATEKDVVYAATANSKQFGRFSNSDYGAQVFSVSSDYTLCKIDVEIYATNTDLATSYLTGYIYSVVSHTQMGSLISTSTNTIALSSLVSESSNTVTFSGFSAAVTASTGTYAIGMFVSSPSDTRYPSLRGISSAITGTSWYGGDGTSWTQQSGSGPAKVRTYAD